MKNIDKKRRNVIKKRLKIVAFKINNFFTSFAINISNLFIRETHNQIYSYITKISNYTYL